MREIEKTVTLRAEGETRTFRIRKLEAFSGARLLKLLSDFQGDGARPFTMAELLFSLPEEEMEKVMRCCMNHVRAELPAGPAQVLSRDGWGVPELEYDAVSCLKLTLEVMAWSLHGFFPESGPPSAEARPSSP